MLEIDSLDALCSLQLASACPVHGSLDREAVAFSDFFLSFFRMHFGAHGEIKWRVCKSLEDIPIRSFRYLRFHPFSSVLKTIRSLTFS
jgi:hypothetical protein